MRSAAVSRLSIRPDWSPVGTGVAGVPTGGVGVVGDGSVLDDLVQPAASTETVTTANPKIRNPCRRSLCRMSAPLPSCCEMASGFGSAVFHEHTQIGDRLGESFTSGGKKT